MNIKIADRTLDYAAAMKKLQLTRIPRVNVPTHITTLTVKDWPVEFTNSVRFILLKLYPTTRLEASIASTDIKLIPDNVIGRLRHIIIDSKCKPGQFSYELAHTYPDDKPLNLTLEDSSIGQYINRSLIAVIEKGRTIKITGDIITSSAVDANNSAYNFCSTFIRDVNLFEEYRIEGFKYNKGVIRIIYQDSASAEAVMRNVFNIFKAIIDDLINNIDEYLQESVNIPYLIVKKDRSTIISKCIERYIHENASDTELFITQTKEAEDVSMAAKITFKDATRDQAKTITLRGLQKLSKDIQRLI